MARAETIESVGEPEGGGGGGGGGNGPVPCSVVCRMEVPRPLHTWPSLLNTNTSIRAGLGAITVHPYHHHLQPFQALCLSCSLPFRQPEAEQEQRTALSPSSTPPPTPPRHRRNERSRVASSDFSGQQSGSDREESRDASRRHGPLPDLLPQNEHPSWGAPHPHQAPRGEAVLELDVMRVANQLRTIGDEFNSTVIRRVRLAPRWQNWRDVYRGLLNFLAQTLSPLYRLT